MVSRPRPTTAAPHALPCSPAPIACPMCTPGSEVEGALAAAGAKAQVPGKKIKGRGRPPPRHDSPGGLKAAQAVARAVADCLAVFGACPSLASLAASVDRGTLAPSWERGVGKVREPTCVLICWSTGFWWRAEETGKCS